MRDAPRNSPTRARLRWLALAASPLGVRARRRRRRLDDRGDARPPRVGGGPVRQAPGDDAAGGVDSRRSSLRAAAARPSRWCVDGGAQARPARGVLRGPRGTRMAGGVAIRRELTVPVAGTSSAVKQGCTGEVPDPLVPVSVEAAGGTRQVFWVSIDVPRTQAAASTAARSAVGPRRRSPTACAWPTSRCRAARAAHLVPRLGQPRRRRRASRRTPRPRLHARARRPTASATARCAGGDAAVGLRPEIARRATSRTRRCSALARGVAARGRAAARDAARRRALLLRRSTSRRRASSASVAPLGRGARAQAAPGVRQLVTATTDPTLGAHRRRLGDAPPRPDPRDARHDARARRRGLGLLLVLRDAGRPDAAARSARRRQPRRRARRPGCRAAPGSSTGRSTTTRAIPTAIRATTARRPGASATATACCSTRDARSAGARRTRRCASRSSRPGCRSPTRRRCSTRRGHGDEARALLARVLPGTAEFVDNPAAWQAVERALLQRLERTS